MATGARVRIDIREKRFPGARGPLFRDFALDIAPSSVVAFLGPSGVGKSTLLRMVAGADRGYQGTIKVDGRPAAKAPAPGFVFQDPRLLPWLDAIGNVRAMDPSVTKDRAAALLARMGLAGSERSLPHALSGGMQRRVSLARALAARPRLLLLDEPFVSLDAGLVAELQDLFAQIVTEQAPTVLMVSHAPADAARLADRIVILGGAPALVAADVSPDLPPVRRTDLDRTALQEDLRRLSEARS